MVAGVLGLIAVTLVAVVVIAPLVSRRLGRVRQVTGAAVVSPVRSPPAGGMAVPAVTVQPSSAARGPFAYDDGVMTGVLEEDTS
jgi:hypothetical protein